MFTWLQILLSLSFPFFSPSLHSPWTRGINSAVPCVGTVRFGLNAVILTPLANLFLPMPVELEHLLLPSIKKSATIATGEPWAARALFHRWVFSVGVRTALHCGGLSRGGGFALYRRLSDAWWPSNKVRQGRVLWDLGTGVPLKCRLPLPHRSHLKQRRWHLLTVLH